jgi:sodium-independent sulfate anion transporter 11
VSLYIEGKDLIPTFVTFITCLVIAVEYGILIGVGINLLFLLYPSARPTVHIEKSTVSVHRPWVCQVDLCEL